MSHDYDRTPPHDEHAEMAVLGGMLLARSAITDVAGLVVGASFYFPKHGWIYDAIATLDAQGEPADAVTVANDLRGRGLLSKIGGAAYLHECMESVPTAANAAHYAQIVRDLYRRRHLINIGTEYVQMGYETDGDDIDEIVDRAQSLAMTLAQNQDGDEDQTLASAYFEVLDSIEHDAAPGLPTGFADFDALTKGLRPGQLVVVAGRPGMGKSVFAEGVLRHTAITRGRPVGMFSLEMSRFEIAKRAIAAQARVPLHRLAYGCATDADWDRINDHAKDIPAAPIYVDDNPNLTINALRAKARQMRTKHNIELLIVDYLQLMDADEKRRGGENRQQDVSGISRGLKLLAKELSLPVIAVAQLNRGPEQRPDKRPVMSDLRDSGSVEQDADIVILIYRDDYYVHDHPRAGEADLIVAKHRGGPKATITVAFTGHYAKFQDMAKS